MSAAKSSSAAQLQELIDQAKSIRPVSPAARARVLKRAQASTLTGAASIAGASVPIKSTWSRAWFSGAASATLLAGAAALAINGRQVPAPVLDQTPVSDAVVVPSAQLASIPLSPSAETIPPAPSPTQVPSARQPARPQESYAGELDLLRRAHAALGNGDFANALRLLAEHGRRFPNGRLAEEREALRVRALSGSGQSDAARRAAHAFAARFPHSVLLARTMSAVDAGK